MALSLEAIPLDIKVLILKHIPDPKSLLSLLIASSQYYDTFLQFQEQIKFEVLLRSLRGNVALMREARILAEAQMLNEIGASIEEVTNFIHENYRIPDTMVTTVVHKSQEVDVINTVENNKPKNTRFKDHVAYCKLRNLVIHQPDTCDRLLQNHQAVTELCHIYANKHMPPRSDLSKTAKEIPLTPSETSRILLAFYRVWTLFIVCKERQRRRRTSTSSSAASSSGSSLRPRLYLSNYSIVDNDVFVRILKVQPYWEVKETLSAQLFLLPQLLPYSVVAKKYQALEDPMFMYSDPIGLSFDDEFSYSLLKTLHFSTIARLIKLPSRSSEARAILEPEAKYFVPGYHLSQLRTIAEPLTSSPTNNIYGLSRIFIHSDRPEITQESLKGSGSGIYSVPVEPFWDKWRLKNGSKFIITGRGGGSRPLCTRVEPYYLNTLAIDDEGKEWVTAQVRTSRI